jgi:small redox-active disulfide protein 2
MIIKVLGPGCHNCHTLEKNVRAALAGLGIEAPIESVTDYGEIAGYGVLRTPGLVVDEEVVVSGRVPKPEAQTLSPAPDGAGPAAQACGPGPSPGPQVARWQLVGDHRGEPAPGKVSTQAMTIDRATPIAPTADWVPDAHDRRGIACVVEIRAPVAVAT